MSVFLRYAYIALMGLPLLQVDAHASECLKIVSGDYEASRYISAKAARVLAQEGKERH